MYIYPLKIKNIVLYCIVGVRIKTTKTSFLVSLHEELF